MIKVSISASTIANLNQRTRDAKTKIAQSMVEIKELETKNIQQSIVTSKTGPNNVPWQPWALSTARQRAREGNAGRGLLNRTGALLSGIRGMIMGTRIRITSDANYSKYLQFGTPRMPARPFMGWRQSTINTLKTKLRNTFK